MDFFDLHCDTLTVCMAKKMSLYANSADVDFCTGKDFGRWNQVFAVFIPDTMDASCAEAYFDSACDFYCSELRSRAAFSPILYPGDVRAAQRGSVLAMENSKGINSIERLELLYERGLRLVTLTWNGQNRAGGGCKAGGGLTERGEELVRAFDRIGIVTDVSHLSDKGFFDVARLTASPFIASHSNARSVYENPRSLSDDQIKIIVQRGGLIGLNFFCDFLGGSGGMDDLLRHAEHILSLGGENALCIGSDYDGCKISDELRGIEKIPAIYLHFEKNGIPPEICSKIFYENAAHFFENILHRPNNML